MHGLILTGPTGVGKSTVQAALRNEHGFWVPRTFTTRTVDQNEPDLLHLSEAEFLRQARVGAIAMPAFFGGYWYGSPMSDLLALQNQPGRAVLNARPYPALALQILIQGMAAVWLTVDDLELSRRRANRHAARDNEEALRLRRQAEDLNDLAYKSCFEHVYTADSQVVERLLPLIP